MRFYLGETKYTQNYDKFDEFCNNFLLTIQIMCFGISRNESRKESWRRKLASEHQTRNNLYIGESLTFGDGGKIF